MSNHPKKFLDPSKIINKSYFEQNSSDFTCLECKGIITDPIVLSCGHNFCSKCFEDSQNCLFCYNPSIKDEKKSKELLEKLQLLKFSFNNTEYPYEEYVNIIINDLEAPPLFNPDNNENNLKNNAKICIHCGKEYDTMRNVNLYEEKNKKLSEKLKNIYEIKRKLQADIYKASHGTEMPEDTLIDKCKHFFGNYKPIFDCCHRAYGCYMCHDENECHEYQISKKVICLLCACIYEGSQCPKCKIKQCYQKKK